VKTLAIVIGACLLIGGVPISAQEPTIPPTAGDPKVYGQYPLGYKAIVTRWLGTKLADPASAVIDWTTEPTAGEYKTQKGERHVGYVVDIKVNARNQFGSYTGKQRYRVVIKNGEVIWGGRPQY